LITEVYKNIYRNEIPLPNNPLKVINSYIILSKDRNLIIDTGFNCDECKESFMKGIDELGLNLHKTDLLITHLHSDHSGLASFLSGKGVRVYAGEIDGKIMNDMTKVDYWNKYNEYKKLFDLEKDNIAFEDHPGYKYCSKKEFEFKSLKEGDLINIGEYEFKVIDIPGHTPGHIGLYDSNNKIFFGGDHVLDRITPNIAFWGFDEDILATYFNSLEKIYNYDIEYIFSSHRSIVKDHKKRIVELLSHHNERLEEIKKILNSGRKSVRDIAASMHWQLRYDKWEDFPNPQKWFASGEAMSHLEHLVYTNRTKKYLEDGILYYKLL